MQSLRAGLRLQMAQAPPCSREKICRENAVANGPTPSPVRRDPGGRRDLVPNLGT